MQASILSAGTRPWHPMEVLDTSVGTTGERAYTVAQSGSLGGRRQPGGWRSCAEPRQPCVSGPAPRLCHAASHDPRHEPAYQVKALRRSAPQCGTATPPARRHPAWECTRRKWPTPVSPGCSPPAAGTAVEVSTGHGSHIRLQAWLLRCSCGEPAPVSEQHRDRIRSRRTGCAG